jgi:Fe2+ or Zn2+ uptake regulation protein
MSSDWAKEAHRRLAAAGYRTGGARTAVIELLGRGGGPWSAQDIADRLRDRGRRVGLSSVYRALSALRTLGMLRACEDEGDVATSSRPALVCATTKRVKAVHAGGSGAPAA